MRSQLVIIRAYLRKEPAGQYTLFVALFNCYHGINDVIISIASFLDGQDHSRSDSVATGAEMSALQVFNLFVSYGDLKLKRING